MSHSRGPSDCKVYVGDLGSNASQTDIEDAFSYYGPLKNVWVARNPPGFAFVEFEDPRDARDSVRGLDGRTICNRRITVEMSTGRTRNRGGSWRPTQGGGRYGGGGGGRNWDPADRCYDCGESGHYSYDCRNKRPVRRSRSRDRGRSRSRTPTKRRRSVSRSISRSRSRDRTRSRSPKRAASRSPRRSSRSPRRNGTSRSPTRSSRRD